MSRREIVAHATLIGATFFDRKERLIHYIVSPSKQLAKEATLDLKQAGIDVHFIVKYDKIRKEKIYQGVWNPVYILYLTPYRVLYNLHRGRYANPKTIYRRKK